MEQFLSGLDELLTQFGQAHDSETIRNITSALNTQYYVSPNCVPALIEIISRSPHLQTRQLAAVELRKRVPKFWDQLEESMKQNLRTQILHTVLNEQSTIVRHAIARDIASMARIDMPDEKWPTLLGFLNESCMSTDKNHREVGIYCLFTMFEVIEEYFMNNTAPLFELFNKLIVDPESKSVRVTTVLALGRLAESIDSEDKNNINLFRNMIPGMVNVLEQCIREEDEDNASKVFEVFNTLVVQDAPLLNEHVGELVKMFLEVASNTSLDDTFRVLALNFLMWVAVYKQHRLKNLKLVDFIIEKLMPIATEEDPEDSDSDSASRVSYKVLNAMATNIPPQKFFSTIMPFIMSYIQNPDANYRKASMMAFAVSVEGCTDIIASKLNELLPVVCQGLQDPQVIVRRAACMALGCLAEEMSADLAEHHQTLLPLVFNLVNDSNPDMIKHACNALDAILEGLGNDIVQYLPLLMEKLLFLLDNAPETETRATVIAAIGSAAHAGTEAFQPYFDNVFARILQLMSLKQTADDQLLRGVATDTAGAIASAVGADVFRPHVQQVMGLAIEQLELDLPRLRECSYALFSILARVFGEEFAPYLPSIVPAILNSCKTEEKNDNLVNDEIDLTNGMDEDLDEDFENFNYNSAIADEKEFAADALGELFEHTKTQFLPFVEPALEELHALCAHIGDGVRKAAIISMATFLRTFYVISNPASPWQPGLPPTYTVHENVQHMIAGVIPTFLVLWKEEDDRMVSAQICQELVSILREVGPVAIAECLEEVSQDTLDIFRKQSLCQQDYDDEELVDEEDDLESETVLISSASDLVAALCETVGPSFASYFEVFMPLIAKYFKPTKTQTERSMAIGCLGECVSGMKQNITPHTEFLYSTFMKACSDEDELVRSNAAFALGSLVLYTQVDLSEHYPTMLNALSPLFNNQTIPNTVDNAAGAIARLILAHPNSVPLDQVLPTFTNALPLKADFEENQAVFDCIFKLFEVQNQFVTANISQYLHIFSQVLSDENQLKDETKSRLIELIRALNAQNPSLNIGASELGRFL